MSLENCILETARLRLLPMCERFAQDIFVSFTAEVTKYMIPSPPVVIEDTMDFINGTIKARKEGKEVAWAITDKTHGEFLGCVGAHKLNTTCPELGIWIKKCAHGHGYGLEAVTAAADFARGHLGEKLEHLVYPVDVRNPASIRIPERLGGIAVNRYVQYLSEEKDLDIVEYHIK